MQTDEKDGNMYYQNILNNLENNNLSYLPYAYSHTISGDRFYIKNFGKILTCIIQNTSSLQLIRLSENFRQSDYYDMDYRQWTKFNPEKYKNCFDSQTDYINFLAVGTFHSNGYYREKCLEKLSAYDNTMHYAFLRLNDWTAPVRKLAEDIISRNIRFCSVSQILFLCPYADKILNSGRRDNSFFNEIYSYMYDFISRNSDKIDAYKIKNYDFYTRKAVYRLICRNNAISCEKFRQIISFEKHGFLQSYLITHFLQLYSPDMQKINEFLMHKSSCVRYCAMQYKYNMLHDVWNGIENLLLDSRHSIREYAVFLLKKHTDFNITEFYKQNLGGTKTVWAIAGIGENGSENDAELLLPFLESDNPKIIKWTVWSLNNLTDSLYEDIYRKLLFSKNISSSKAAYKAIVKSKIRYGSEMIYNNLINASNNNNIKIYLINILCQNEDSWERLPFLLKILRLSICPEKNKRIIMAINGRNPYKKISPVLENQIRSEIALARVKTPENISFSKFSKLLQTIELELKFVCR